VAVVAVACYLGYIGAHVASGGDLRDYILIRARFINQSHASSVIRLDPRYHYRQHGYDGQFYYYIALDPLRARYYMDRNIYGKDAAAYRYGRIFYPLAARALALGQTGWIPATMLLLNILGVGLGTLAVAAWLAQFGLSAWLALIYAFYPGVVLGVLRDLTDPLGFALAAAGVYILRSADPGSPFGGRRRLLWAAGCFALAGLTREITLLAPVVYALWLLIRRDARGALTLGAISLLPALLWRIWLEVWLGSPGLPARVGPALPFVGIVQRWVPHGPIQLAGVVIPAVLLGLLALWACLRGARSPEIVLLLANVVLFVVLLNPTSYADIYGSARMAIGVPLFALFSLPSILPVARRAAWTALAASCVLWGVALAIPA
jgi:hypothetical protein